MNPARILNISKELSEFGIWCPYHESMVRYVSKYDDFEPVDVQFSDYAKSVSEKWRMWLIAKCILANFYEFKSVDKCLPEDGSECLVWKEPISEGYGHSGYVLSCFDNGKFEDVYTHEKVTHWTYLPKPPKE